MIRSPDFKTLVFWSICGDVIVNLVSSCNIVVSQEQGIIWNIIVNLRGTGSPDVYRENSDSVSIW